MLAVISLHINYIKYDQRTGCRAFFISCRLLHNGHYYASFVVNHEGYTEVLVGIDSLDGDWQSSVNPL